MHWPGKIPQGVVSQEIASTLDLFPTFMELAGGKIPDDLVIDGKNICPLIFDKPGAQQPT